ncbi:MAG: hypothetical protein ACYDAE_16815 [Steroidobacteraceae bacterium]
MNTFADSPSNREQGQNEAACQELKLALAATLVELGKVSETRGGWFGPKLDVGAGFVPY